METLAELKQMNGTRGSEEFMLIGNTLYRQREFERDCEAGYMPKRIAKKGWKATHRETWTWQFSRNRFGDTVMYKTNAQRVEL